jgi:hypothetical protein
MQTLKTTWTGIRPLLMTNPQTVKLSNAYAIANRDLSNRLKAARKKQDESMILALEPQQIRNDWESSIFWDDTAGHFFIPDTQIVACIRQGAQAGKKGKDVERAVLMTETEAVVVNTVAHNSLDAYFNDPAFRMECPAKLPPKTGSLVWKTRAMMPTGWQITFNLEYDETIIAKKALVDAMENAGRLCGLGGWRPKFGRFLVELA